MILFIYEDSSLDRALVIVSQHYRTKKWRWEYCGAHAESDPKVRRGYDTMAQAVGAFEKHDSQNPR